MSSFTAEKQPRPKFRNLNLPLLLTYRLPLPGLVSIMHRISGAVLFLMLPLLLWLFDLSLASELSFERLRSIASNWWFKLLLVFLVWGFFHHLVAGIRYLLLDLHIGIDLKSARASAIAVYAVSLPLALIAALKIFGVF
ncbi:MAG TPA: succinate dehydrogenase, cytochrome b556 subunit [Burkholderiaceae bacterium]|nr:succinate dehydrogenase, cytochrome b556 subunit [Burkholderiaceae bacterium]